MKYAKIALLLFFPMLFLTATVFAAPNINDLTQGVAGNAGYDVTVSAGFLSETVGKIIRTVLAYVGTLFLALTVYAGILWMTSQGSDDQVGKATKILKAAIVGLFITLAAYTITRIAMVVANPPSQTQSLQQTQAAQQLLDQNRELLNSNNSRLKQ